MKTLLQQAAEYHENSRNHGFYDERVNEGEKIALMHEELSEALKALRKGNPPDEKVPNMNECVVELADCVIRILDFCHYKEWDLQAAMDAKHQYNLTREAKHGKLF